MTRREDSRYSKVMALTVGDRLYEEVVDGMSMSNVMRTLNPAISKRSPCDKLKVFKTSAWTGVPVNQAGGPVRVLVCCERVK